MFAIIPIYVWIIFSSHIYEDFRKYVLSHTQYCLNNLHQYFDDILTNKCTCAFLWVSLVIPIVLKGTSHFLSIHQIWISSFHTLFLFVKISNNRILRRHVITWGRRQDLNCYLEIILISCIPIILKNSNKKNLMFSIFRRISP